MRRCAWSWVVAAVWLSGCGEEAQEAQGAPADQSPDMEMIEDVAEPDPSPVPDVVEEEDAPGPRVDVPEDTEPVTESVSLTTTDDKTIAGVFSRPGGAEAGPAVLLLHQFGNSKSEWTDFQARLTASGFAVLAIDIRGHGDSDPQDGAPTDIFRDPEQAPRDVQAAMDFLKASEAVDPERIGAVGTSVGSNLTVVAMALGLGVQTIVPISPRLSAIEALAGSPESLPITSIFCVAGALDGQGAQADTCRTLAESATVESRLQIFEDSSVHGADVLRQFPEQADEIETWLLERL